MAHNPNHRRNLAAAPNPEISIPTTDLTGKRQPKKSSAAAAAVYNLANHFSRLHPQSKPQKVVDTQLQVKALSKSVNLEHSAQKIGRQGKRVVLESDKNPLVVVGERREKETAKVERESGKEEGGNEAILKPRRRMEKVGLISRRRSFCDAQLELANFLITSSAKVVSADMPPFMQIHAVGFARKTKDSLEKFTSKSLALSLKKEFDGVYGPAWHCIVGTSFGSFVTHSVGGFQYFSLDQKVFVLLFKTAVQRAD